MKVKIKILDILIFLIILLLALYFIFKIRNLSGSSVIVNADGKIYEYSLSQDGLYTFDGAIGKTTMEIKNGKVRFLDSCCPHKTCVSQGYGLTIVCLPNKVIATVNSGEDLDAIAE